MRSVLIFLPQVFHLRLLPENSFVWKSNHFWRHPTSPQFCHYIATHIFDQLSLIFISAFLGRLFFFSVGLYSLFYILLFPNHHTLFILLYLVWISWSSWHGSSVPWPDASLLCKWCGGEKTIQGAEPLNQAQSKPSYLKCLLEALRYSGQDWRNGNLTFLGKAACITCPPSSCLTPKPHQTLAPLSKFILLVCIRKKITLCWIPKVPTLDIAFLTHVFTYILPEVTIYFLPYRI